jgi:peptidoglycan-associated lipoprotein
VGGIIGEDKEELEMKQVWRPWTGSTITLLLVSVFLTGCPKRPEIAETAPKAIGPQGAISMPAPPPSPPTVSAVPPTVPAPEEKSPAEVTAQPGESEAALEGKVQEAETPPAGGQAYQEPMTPPTQEAQAAPEAGAAPEPQAPQPTEGEIKPQRQVGEGEVKPEGQAKEAGAKPETSAAVTEPEVKPEPPAPIAEAEVKPETPPAVKEAEATPGAEVGAPPEVVSPPAGQPSAEAVSPAAPAEPVAPAPVPTPQSPPPAPPAVAEAPKAVELTVKDIYFDFDQAAIRDDSRKTLADNIQWFKANPAAKVTLEGHCDERGSSEYNLALGERRARVTRDFLVVAGIEASRINTISFGKERPFVLGHDESAWKWNRRAHFVVSPK